jgi:hypothetical protein
VFARLTGCEGVDREVMEGIMLTVSPYMEEARNDERVKTRRQDTRDVLDARFPGQVPAAVAQRISAETDLGTLSRWLRLAATETLAEFQRQM